MSDTWKLVPVEPDKLMLVKGENALHSSSHGDFHATEGEIEACYRAMLGAAPAPPVPSSVQEIMRLMMPYISACLDFATAFPDGELEGADAACTEALKPLQAALTAMVDDNHRLKFELAGVNAMRRPMEWINVDERLPEDGEMVLVCVRNGVGSSDPESNHFEAEEVQEIDFGDFNEPGGYMQCYGGPHGAFADDITHWMPLPEPPTPDIEPEQGDGGGV